MATIPQKTGIPLVIDSDLASTVDFHIATTNFTKAVDQYGDFLGLSQLWNKTKQSHDPITAQAQFFHKLNSDQFNIQEECVNIFATDDDYNVMHLDTYLDQNEIWIRAENNIPVSKTSGEGILSYEAVNLLTGNRRWIPVDSNKDANYVKDKIKTLSTKFGATAMNETGNEEFLLSWYEKFHQAHDKVKEEYKKLLDVDDTENYFTPLSDSIGIIQRSGESIDSTSIPMIDVEFELLDTIPKVAPPSVIDKLDIDTQSLLIESSKKVNTLFRMNAVRVIEKISTQRSPHGSNLMTDHIHWIRMSESTGLISGIISSALGSVYKLFGYMQIARNKQKIKPSKFDLVLQNSIVKVDFLKEKIQSLASASTSARTNESVLKTSGLDLPELD